MQSLEVSGAVRPLCGSLGVKGLILLYTGCSAKCVPNCVWQSDSYIGPFSGVKKPFSLDSLTLEDGTDKFPLNFGNELPLYVE